MKAIDAKDRPRRIGGAAAVLRVVCWLGVFAGPAAIAQPAWFSPEWKKMRDRMGPIDFDGRLAMSLPVHRLEAEGMGCDIALIHKVDIDGDNLPTSRWVFSGLSSYLVPESRNSIKALLPGGRILHFPQKPSGTDPFPDTTGNWRLTKMTGQWAIQSPLGNRYFFDRGQLNKIITDRGATLTAVATGGHIRSIAPAGDPAHPFVSCDYDSLGEPLAVRFGDGENARFRWGDGGLLLEWNAGDGAATRFAYRNRMVAQVAEPNRAAIDIEWGPVEYWAKSTHIWLSPLRVTRVDRLSFTYDLGHEGSVYKVTDADTGVSTVTKFNWLAKRVSQRVGQGVTVVAKYSTTLSPPGYFIRIGPVDGAALEEYTYGPDKRLTQVRRLSPDGSETNIVGSQKIVEGWDGETQGDFPEYER